MQLAAHRSTSERHGYVTRTGSIALQ